jgi:secretion/DNA translocation related TadE-like protein
VVLVLVLVALLATVALVGAGVGAVVATHRRVAAAADLAALAGASAVGSARDPCAAATDVAAANGAVLSRCELDGAVVSVVAHRGLPDALGGHDLSARARAGPVEPGLR